MEMGFRESNYAVWLLRLCYRDMNRLRYLLSVFDIYI
jgi:hypothetical protein